MKIIIWLLAALIIAPWTGAAWLTWALVDMSGNWLSGNADMLALEPHAVQAISWFARAASGTGEVIILIAWVLGTAIIAGLAWSLTKLIDRERRVRTLNWHPDDPRSVAASQHLS